jgi:phosphatidylserine/phosphatidylglycerophosphate/cardiolipin synthase-like enzyme
MRFKNTSGTYKLYAVTGTNSISFAISCSDAEMKGLLGFTVEKIYTKSSGQKVKVTVMGFKVFKERVQNPIPGGYYSTYDNPIQSFVWDDFSVYPGSKYTYQFTPLYDDPLNIRRGKAEPITVQTEPAWKKNDHSIFFNRGVASSQAYAVKFGNKLPDEVGDDAFLWLSRGLKEALVKFIGQAKKDEIIYGCFYEFRYDEILSAIRDAADLGVKFEIIYDAKENEHIDSNTGKTVDSFPKVENEKAIVIAGLSSHPKVKLYPRAKNKSYISHNKFMVLANAAGPVKVWTGSTNISKGGIFGQANVGHSIEDKITAKKFHDYWLILQGDPDSATLKNGNETIQPSLQALNAIQDGETSIFSPRKNVDMLQFYADLLDSAEYCSCITLAFGVNKVFEEALSDNSADSPLTFLLLERDDADISDYVYKNNVVKAVGSYIGDNTLFKWVKETTTNALQLNTHVMYVHTKFLIRDPLGSSPVIVTGSANFSEAATTKNDENMIIIKGNKRVADIYFTEFMRLFNHYYFRWIVRKLQEQNMLDSDNPAFLIPDDSWTAQYKRGKYKQKRVQLFAKMKGAKSVTK